jgi:hypothetical protein
MSDISPYGVTQHPDAAMVTANQLVGSPVGGQRENAAIEGVGPALFSTAPYKPPAPGPGPKGCWAKNGTCRSPALKGEKLCFFHSQDAK